MIAFVEGSLEHAAAEEIIISNNGIGLRIKMPASSISVLPSKGSIIKIYTYMHVREDAILLFGFLSPDDLDIFKLLINVNGIGPKGGLSILSSMTQQQLRTAIASADADFISKAPGIGKKTAQRLILDLKDKINFNLADENLDSSYNKLDNSKEKTQVLEAQKALQALGYSRSEAARALLDIDENIKDVQDLIKAALKNLY